MKTGRSLWIEDDATTHDPNHENLARAWLRLFGEPFDRQQAVETIDGGDCTLYRMPNRHIACESYPGNSEIFEGAS